MLLSLGAASASPVSNISSYALSIDSLLALFGKLHPALVHFPIALIIVAALIEFIALLRRTKNPSPSALTCLGIGSVAAVVAATAGWLNAADQEFTGNTLDLLYVHRWGGVCAATLAVLGASAACLHHRIRTSFSFGLYRAALFAAAICVSAVAHFGGLIVHGEDYYSQALEGSESEKEEPKLIALKAEQVEKLLPPAASREVTYKDDIHSLLHSQCGKCHGQGKKKGDFNIDNPTNFFKGGRSGSAVMPKNSAESLLIQMVAGVHKDHVMPTKGRRLTAEEIGLLRKWINDGAVWKQESAKAHHSSEFPKSGFTLTSVKLPVAKGQDENQIDLLLNDYRKKNSLADLKLVDDATFLRRVTLDTIGVIPSAEDVREFVSDQRPNKRQLAVDKLLNDNFGYATHYLSFWNDLLRNDYTGAGFLQGRRKEFTDWLFLSLLENKPYNDFAFGLASRQKGAEGFVNGITWWRDDDQPQITDHVAMQAGQNVAQIFMAVNLKCAACHDSFTDAWTLEDSFGMANAYARTPLETHRCNFPTGITTAPRFIYPEVGAIQGNSYAERVVSMATILTSKKNGRFARTIVNRLWNRFFGYGLIEPVDELDHTAWSPELLDWLAQDLIDHNFDLKHTMRLIFNSRAYQAQAVATPEKATKDFKFTGPLVRRLSAEQFLDSIDRNLDISPHTSYRDTMRVARLSSIAATSPRTLADNTAPKMIFSAPNVKSGATTLEINTKVPAGEKLWLIAYPNFRYSEKMKTNLEAKARKKFERQQRSGKEAVDMVTRGEWVDWINPRISAKDSNGKELSIDLTEQMPFFAVSSSPDQAYAANKNLDGSPLNIADGAKIIQGSLYRILSELPFSALSFDLPKDVSDITFTAQARLHNTNPRNTHGYNFYVMTDLQMRSAFLEATPLMFALGRPRREQVSSTRTQFTDTLLSLELLRGSELSVQVNDGAREIYKKLQEDNGGNFSQRLVNAAFNNLLLRSPEPQEAEKALDFLTANPSPEGFQDLLWSIIMLPEFSLIH